MRSRKRPDSRARAAPHASAAAAATAASLQLAQAAGARPGTKVLPEGQLEGTLKALAKEGI